MKKMFLEISQNSQENSCRPEAQVFSSEFCEISKNIFFHRTSLVGSCFWLYKKESSNPKLSDINDNKTVCKSMELLLKLHSQQHVLLQIRIKNLKLS